jgi:hypothetical protein
MIRSLADDDEAEDIAVKKTLEKRLLNFFAFYFGGITVDFSV